MKREHRLYNVMFPIWMLIFFPQVWLVVIPANFIIDSLVLLVMFRLMVPGESLGRLWRRSILRVVLIGFFSDFIGAVPLVVIVFGGTWLGNNLPAPAADALGMVMAQVMGNPFASGWAFLIISVFVLLAGFCIYKLNCWFSLCRLNLSRKQEKRIALVLAVVTAPWLYYLPLSAIYH